LGPQLASLTLKLEVARDAVRSQPDLAEHMIDGVMAKTEAAVADIRGLVYALRPPALDELGLIGALREHIAQHTPPGLSVVFDAPERPPPLPAAVEVAAYRIAQEAFTNVVQHAHARQCVVRLAVAAGRLDLTIRDDGRGLPEQRRAGVGLHSMRERAAELGGTCAVEAGVDAGTRVSVCLPYTAADPPQ
jgi:signal transduction histidine kinase